MEEERKKEILEKIRKAGNEEYETEWTAEGKIGQQKKKSEMKKGKKSRAKGAQFELVVRKDLEEKGWIVDKWSNNVDLEVGKIIPAKRKFNPFNKVMTIGTGFPDFVCFRLIGDGKYNVVGFEVKVNGLLSKEEKDKAVFLLKSKVFNDFFLVKTGEKKGSIEYVDFKERYKKNLDGGNTPPK